jgi:hypothetical protein
LELGKLEEVSIVNEYLDVLLAELTQVLPEREIEFVNVLVAATKPILRTLY